MSTMKSPLLTAAAILIGSLSTAQTKVEVTFQGQSLTNLDDLYMAPDGTLILNGEFLLDAGSFPADLLLAVPITGGEATLVTGNAPAGDADTVAISTNGVVVFAGDGDDTGVLGLNANANNFWTVPVTADFFGGDLPEQLTTASSTPLEINSPTFSPDGSTLYFLKEVVDNDDSQDPAIASEWVIASVPVGGGAVTNVTAASGEPGFVAGVGLSRFSFDVTPDGSTIVFAARAVDAPPALYSVPVAGGTPTPIPFASPLIEGADIFEVSVSPDGESIVFIGDLVSDAVDELFVIPIEGGEPLLISSEPVSGGDVQSFEISPDSTKVIYVSDEEINGDDELFIASIAGGPSRQLSQEPVESGDVRDRQDSGVAFTPDGERVVYHGDLETNGLREIFLVDVPDLGDFNADGVVDAADYTVARDSLGAVDDTAINDNGDGIPGVTEDDLAVWAANFGATYEVPSSAGVPEPGTVVLACVAIGGWSRRRVLR